MYVSKISCISYYFQKNISACLQVQRSVAVSVYILSSKGANQLQVAYIRTLENIQGNFLGGILFKATVLKCIHSNFFLEICRRFRTSKKLVLENSLSIYNTADKDHAKIL